MRNFISTHKPEIFTALAVLLYAIYFTTVSFLRYDNFYTGRYDLGNMDQTVWNTINGRIFETTTGTEITSRLVAHADFILILISPLYLIWEDPRMLLLLQTVVVALGAVFVFKISHMILGSKNAASVLSVLFLLNPALQFTNLYDFHPVTLATTLLLGTFYFFIKKKYFWFTVFAILSGLTKEQVWVVIALFGIYTVFFEFIKIFRKKTTLTSRKTLHNLARGGIIAIASFSIFYFLVSIAIPNAKGGEHFALSYYSDFGDSPTSVIRNVVLSPGEIIQVILEKSRIDYLRQLFLPLGYLSILSPLILIFALPDFAINLLSNNSNLHQIYYQYTAVITPFIFISAIFGIKNAMKWFPRISLNLLLVFLTTTTLYSAYSFGPLPGARRPNLDMVTKPLPDKEIVQSFISRVPEDYKIAATNNLGSHLSRRRNIFTIPEGINEADMVLFLTGGIFFQPSTEKQEEMIEELKKNSNFELILEQGSFVVFQKVTL
ncbi:MAG: DUF2079 domain-containing protein [Candidatus Levyibacteriota bacterium]